MRRDYIATDPDVMAEVRFVIVAIWLFGGNDSRSHSGFHAVVVAIEYSTVRGIPTALAIAFSKYIHYTTQICCIQWQQNHPLRQKH